MQQKKSGLLKEVRKQLKIKPKQLDAFIHAKGTSTKYYLEDSFHTNKMFRYLLFLKLKGVSLDKLFSDYIKSNKLKPPKE